MIVLILAAGYATRLYPLTLNTPKPLLKVGPRAIIEHCLVKIEELTEVTNCFIITNQKFFAAFTTWAAVFSRGGRFKAPIEVINDETTTNENRLGAIRDIEFAVKKKNISDDLLVIGGDNIFEFSLKRFVDFARSNGPNAALALFDIKDKNKASLYGIAKIDAANRVVGFEEKPATPQSTLIATCVYYFPKEKGKLISDFLSSGNKSDAPGNYIKWLSRTDKVYGFVFKEKWFDIGDIRSLEEADGLYKDKI